MVALRHTYHFDDYVVCDCQNFNTTIAFYGKGNCNENDLLATYTLSFALNNFTNSQFFYNYSNGTMKLQKENPACDQFLPHVEYDLEYDFSTPPCSCVVK